MDSCKTKRLNMIKYFFPQGIPELWCPLLTNYDSNGNIDKSRMKAHVKSISPWVKNFLVPGSTGDGWEMTNEEIYEVLDVMLSIAENDDIQILVGILKTDKGEAKQCIQDILQWLQKRTGKTGLQECLKSAHVCGFTVCPPKGKGISQKEIETELSSILEIGVPMAFYQLPQITENEISPEVILNLAQNYSNFYLFKDTSGEDKVALSGYDYEGVFLVRGAEGNYSHWLRCNGGYYDGFLLSSANCFAEELYKVINNIKNGNVKEAINISEKLSGAISEVFNAVDSIPEGNAFTNANKAIDHVFAYGENAVGVKSPRLHAGSFIPEDVINSAIEIIKKYGLMTNKAYLL